MKLIGKGKDDKWIAEIERTELAMLTDYYYGSLKFEVGQEVRIGALYNQLKVLSEQPDKVQRTIAKLNEAASALEKIDPLDVVREAHEG